jgi:hypothetical protein
MATLGFAGFLAAGAAFMTGADGPECVPTDSCGALSTGMWTIWVGVALAYLVSIGGMIWATRRNQLVLLWPLLGWLILAVAFSAGKSSLDKYSHPYSLGQVSGWGCLCKTACYNLIAQGGVL